VKSDGAEVRDDQRAFDAAGASVESCARSQDVTPWISACMAAFAAAVVAIPRLSINLNADDMRSVSSRAGTSSWKVRRKGPMSVHMIFANCFYEGIAAILRIRK